MIFIFLLVVNMVYMVVNLYLRKVQAVGYSTLVVSLPKNWTKKVGLKKGDMIRFEMEDGSLRMFLDTKVKQEVPLKCVINADLCNEPELLTRILHANYYVGHSDTIQIESKKELKREHLEEIRNTVERLTGIGIVEQTMNHITIQNFVDPTKFPVLGLIRRLHVIASSMQHAAIHALVEHKPELAIEALRMEVEADRLYWLILRQLRLAMDDPEIGKKIGYESTLRGRGVVGDRLIAKCLEEMADYTEDIAREVLEIKDYDFSSHEEILFRISELNELVKDVSNKTIKALFKFDIKLANESLEKTKEIDKIEEELTVEVIRFRHIQNIKVVVSLRSIVRDLKQISRYCNMIAEIVINRAIRSGTSDIWKLEKL